MANKKNTTAIMKKETKANLPAKREINIFTTGKNVVQADVQKVEAALKESNKLRLTIDAKEVLVTGNFWLNKINLDTFTYIVDNYGFEKPALKNSSIDENKIYFISGKEVESKQGIWTRLSLISEEVDINLLPNDIKQAI